MKKEKLVKSFLKSSIAGSDVVLQPYDDTSQFLTSFESFSIVDLLGEGPIGGLVDKNGAYVSSTKSLCGIYLNDVPVRETLSKEAYNNKTLLTAASGEVVTDLDIINGDDYIAIVNKLKEYDSDFTSVLDNFSAADAEKKLAAIGYEKHQSLKGYFLNKRKDYPFLLKGSNVFSEDSSVKYLILPYTSIQDMASLNLDAENLDMRVMFEKASGEELLTSRYFQNSNKQSYFEKSIVSKVPDPILNLTFGTEKVTSPNGPKYPTNINVASGGYIIIPLKNDDVVSIGAENAISITSGTGLVDPTSNSLNSSRIFLQSTSEKKEGTYNFDKVSLNIRNGFEDQKPITNIKSSSRSYDASFSLKGAIESYSFEDKINPEELSEQLSPSEANRAYKTNSDWAAGSSYSVGGIGGGVIQAFLASTDTGGNDYAEWARSSLGNYRDERAVFKHIIDNEDVDYLSAVFTINSLYDTKIEGDDAGNPVPSFLNIGIELGLEGDDDIYDPYYETLISLKKQILFGLEGLVRGSPFRFMVGGGSDIANNTHWIASTNNKDRNLERLKLPKAIGGRKRYIKIFRLTPETFSSKRFLDISLASINEHYRYTFNYPLSAHAGVKIDSRSFSTVPSRKYDIRQKKILIPSNYYPLHNDGRDKRFIRSAAEYANQSPEQIYFGDWDGTFRYDWSDNPAWILYDLLNDPVYGIGNQFDDLKDINIWKLYEIGRVSDAVDDSGNFIGVPDGYGGLEPRFSCNIIINNEQEAFDIISSIATIFRGTAFYAGSDVDFYYDHEDEPIALFSNSNVANGEFQYSDSLRSSRYTVVEIPYLDKRDDFLQKVEFYEDDEGIKNLGYVKKTFQGIGITSRGQAQRFARYAALSNKIETEQVSFAAGNEGYLVQPGDIIQIDDDLKKLETSHGHIHSVDYSNFSMIIPNMDTGNFQNSISVYNVTGENSLESLFQEAYENENKITNQEIEDLSTSNIHSFDVDSYSLTGDANSGGTGIVVNLNSTQDNIDKLNDVVEGSFFAIPLTDRNQNLYKVVTTSRMEGEVEISAAQYEKDKFAAIESGIRFDNSEDYFNNLDVSGTNIYPPAPSSIAMSVASLDEGVMVQVSFQAPQSLLSIGEYELTLMAPDGTKKTKTIPSSGQTETVNFNGFTSFGTYTVYIYSIASNLLKTRSKTFGSHSEIFSISDFASYNTILFEDVTIVEASATNTFSKSTTNSSGTASFESYSADLNLNWTLEDRAEFKIANQEDYILHYEKPSVSIDFISESGTEYRDVYKTLRTNSVFIPKEKIENIFGGSYPRNFKINLRVTGKSQTGWHTGSLEVHNPKPEFSNWQIVDSFDSVVNRFSLHANGPQRLKQDVESINIYTGNNPNFVANEDSFLMSQSINPNDSVFPKLCHLASRKIYPIIENNALLCFNSPLDQIFKQGEKIALNFDNENPNYINNISGSGPYELVLGKTIDSYFYFDAGYSELGRDGGDGEAQRLRSLSYFTTGNTGLINDDYYPLNFIEEIDRSGDYVGLFQAENNGGYVTTEDSTDGIILHNGNYNSLPIGEWQSGLWTGYVNAETSPASVTEKTGDGWYIKLGSNNFFFALDYRFMFPYERSVGKNEKSKVIDFDENGIKLASSQTNSPLQSGYSVFSAAAWIKPMSSKKAYIFDLGSKTGGWSFWIDPYVSSSVQYTYSFDIQLGDTSTSTTGDLLRVTGAGDVPADAVSSYKLGEWCHVGLNFYTKNFDSTNSGFAEVYINGELSNSNYASGSGVAQSFGSSCCIGTAFDETVDNTSVGQGGFSTLGFKGKMADIAMYYKRMSPDEMGAIYHGNYNEYLIQLSTGDQKIVDINGNNTYDNYFVESLEDTIIRSDINNSTKITNYSNFYDALKKSVNFTGIRNQFTLRTDVNVENESINRILNQTFYLDKNSYFDKKYIWKGLRNPEYKVKWMGPETYFPNGRWQVYSGAENDSYLLSNHFFYYTGVDFQNPGKIVRGSGIPDSITSGHVPVGEYLSPKEDVGPVGGSIENAMTNIQPLLSSQTKGGASLYFADFYVRFSATDYIGTGETYPRRNLPAIPVKYAHTSILSSQSRIQTAISAGQQLHQMIKQTELGSFTVAPETGSLSKEISRSIPRKDEDAGPIQLSSPYFLTESVISKTVAWDSNNSVQISVAHEFDVDDLDLYYKISSDTSGWQQAIYKNTANNYFFFDVFFPSVESSVSISIKVMKRGFEDSEIVTKSFIIEIGEPNYYF